MVYYVDGRWAPAVHAFNFTTGQEMGAYDLDGYGVGDLAVSRSGDTMYVWAPVRMERRQRQLVGVAADLSGDTFVRQQDSFTSWRRDPLDTPILLTASEDRVFNKQQCFASADLSQLLVSFSENIYEISLHGDLAVGTAHVFNAHTGAELYTLPFQTTVSAFSSDQKTLFLVNRATRELALVPVQLIADIPGPGLVPNPADGAWSGRPGPVELEFIAGRDQVRRLPGH